MNSESLKSLAETASEISEAFRLGAGQDVNHDHHSADFAKEYVSGHKGQHAPGGPSAKHEKDEEKFHSNYHVKHTRTGFGGSGTSVYTHKKTGHSYEAQRYANGRGFHGTTHSIRKLTAGA
jgi:hypothetical protein